MRGKGGALNDKGKNHLNVAAKIYEKCMTYDKKNVYAANGLGIVLAELGHAQAATDIFSKINDQSSMLHSRINLAHMYMSNEVVDQSTEAAKLYEVCVEQCDKTNVPLHVEYLMYLSRAYLRSTQFDKSLLSLATATALKPEDPNIWFSVGATMVKYANSTLDRANNDSRYLKVALVEKAIAQLNESRVLFQKAHDVAVQQEKEKEKTDGVTTEKIKILYTKEHAVEYIGYIGSLEESEEGWLKTAQLYLDAARVQEGKNQETREQTLQQLKEEENKLKEMKELQILKNLEEKNKRETRAREITAKAAEQNIQAAKEAKAVAVRKKAQRSRPKRKRDSEILGAESRSEDSSGSSSDSESSEDEEEEMGMSSKSKSITHKKGTQVSPPVKKKAKLTSTAAAIFSDSDDSDDDEEMIVSSVVAPTTSSDGTTTTAAPVVKASKGLLDDSDEDD